MWNTNAPQGHIPCAIFSKFAEFVPHFIMRQLLKLGWICSRGYEVMEVLSQGGLVALKFSAPPSGKTMRQTRNSFPGVRTCSRSSITMPSLVGHGFHPLPGWPKTFEFLVHGQVTIIFVVSVSVRLFVMVALWNRADHYIFILFLLLLFPRLISAVGDWMFTILRHMVWP